MPPNGEVNVSIEDGALGAVSVPPTAVQGVVGCSSSGTALQLVSTRNKAALIAAFGYGPLVEDAALVIDAGGTVLAVKVASTTPGAAGAVTFAGTGTSVVTVTGAAFDEYDVWMLVTLGGTIGTGPIRFQLSLDAGRTYGPAISLGTANSYAIPNTGLTLHFAAGTLVTGDTAKFATTPPLWSMADVTSALSVLGASSQLWGSGIHVVGTMTGSQATTLQANLETLATSQFRYTYGLIDTRDFTSTDVTEAAWMTAVEADFASVDAKRVIAGTGYVNIQSPIKNPVCGAPMYRRCLSWAAAQRMVQVPVHVHLGRVKDGGLTGVTGPGTDSLATDGFIYHDERINPGFNDARLMAARTIVGRPGVYIRNANMLAPPGSDFTRLEFRRVMDVACTVAHDTFEEFINDNVRLNADGTILEKDAQHIEAIGRQALKSALVAPGSATSVTVVVDRSQNIQTTSILKVTIRVFALGYLLEIDLNLGFQSTAEAA